MKKILQKLLFICGILSSLLYVLTDILGGAVLWEGYDFTVQFVSELTAIDSPVRSIILPLFIVDNLLVIAFGFGIWIYADKKKSIQINGCLLTVIGLIGLITILFFPIHLDETEKNYLDTLHIVFSVISVVLILLTITITIVEFKNWFRFFAAGVLLTFVVPALFSFLIGLKIIAEQSAPWVGIMERINIYGYLLWVMVLAIMFLKIERKKESNRIKDEVTM